MWHVFETNTKTGTQKLAIFCHFFLLQNVPQWLRQSFVSITKCVCNRNMLNLNANDSYDLATSFKMYCMFLKQIRKPVHSFEVKKLHFFPFLVILKKVKF